MLTYNKLKLIHDIAKQTTLAIRSSMTSLALAISSTIAILGIWPENICVVAMCNIIHELVVVLFQRVLLLSFILSKRHKDFFFG